MCGEAEREGERQSQKKRQRNSLYVCMRERDFGCVCFCVRKGQRERKTEKGKSKEGTDRAHFPLGDPIFPATLSALSAPNLVGEGTVPFALLSVLLPCLGFVIWMPASSSKFTLWDPTPVALMGEISWKWSTWTLPGSSVGDVIKDGVTPPYFWRARHLASPEANPIALAPSCVRWTLVACLLTLWTFGFQAEGSPPELCPDGAVLPLGRVHHVLHVPGS